MNKFKVAFKGLFSSFSHLSIMIQFIIAACVIIFGFIVSFSLMEWVAIILCIALVIIAEMFNTCIEKVCDLYSTDNNDKIRDIKDLAAGTVLMASIISVVVGCIVLAIHFI